jgi:hypothetical protein
MSSLCGAQRLFPVGAHRDSLLVAGVKEGAALSVRELRYGDFSDTDPTRLQRKDKSED